MKRRELLNEICPTDCNRDDICDTHFCSDMCHPRLNKMLDEYDEQIKYELLDRLGEYLFNSRYASEKIADFDYDQTVTFTKLEWMKIVDELKAEVGK